MKDEKKLISLCKKKGKKGQKKLFDKYSRFVFVICMRYSKNKQDAEDIMQETFLKIFDNIDKFDEENYKTFKPWIQKITVNSAINYFKKNEKYRFNEDIDEIQETQISSRQEKEPDFTKEELMKALSMLPEGKRTIFNLYAIEGYKHREIAEMLDIKEVTSKTQYMKAKNELQTNLIQLMN